MPVTTTTSSCRQKKRRIYGSWVLNGDIGSETFNFSILRGKAYTNLGSKSALSARTRIAHLIHACVPIGHPNYLDLKNKSMFREAFLDHLHAGRNKPTMSSGTTNRVNVID
jgi:hypothetical protein